MNTTNYSKKPPDFSLVQGGPLFQLLRRAHLFGEALELLPRRIPVISLVTWLPLLFLSVLDGHAPGAAVTIPFLYDIDTHVRFLIALPGLIACELIVHLRIGPAVRQFEERGIVVKEEIPKFNAIIGSVTRLSQFGGFGGRSADSRLLNRALDLADQCCAGSRSLVCDEGRNSFAS